MHCEIQNNKMAAATKEVLVLDNFIDGKFLTCDKYIDSYDPSTGKVYCKVPDSGKAEVDRAVEAARKAFSRSVEIRGIRNVIC